jgi:hypothetical protein
MALLALLDRSERLWEKLATLKACRLDPTYQVGGSV